MRGELVIVREYGGRPLVRRVWDTNEDRVYICGEDEYQRHVKGKDALPPIGFPREDVFVYRPEFGRVERDQIDWGKLVRWSEGTREEDHDGG